MEKRMRRLFVFGVVIILLVCIILYCGETSVHTVDLSKESGIKVNSKIEYFFDKMEIKDCPAYQGGSDFFLSGWIVLPGEEVSSVSYSILLKPVTSKKALALPTQIVERAEVQKRYGGGKNLNLSGFCARVKLSKLDLAHTRYEIVLRYRCNDRDEVLYTGQTIGGDAA